MTAPDSGVDGGAGNGDPRTGGAAEDPTGQEQRSLERSLGLKEALAIGVGTMVGAGIFVFPGLAAGRAGPASMLSFAVGAGIALLVALPTAELATAMPESGGVYHFVSRGLGPAAGTLVGLGQWSGLMFAAAFYLVGFGYYLSDTLAEVGLSVGEPVGVVAAAAAALLTAVSIAGTRKSGNLQKVIVAALVAILGVFLLYGGLDATGVFGAEHVPEAFAPFGALPIFTTAALVFTSYLGFAQIATVAGEIREPSRNLPRALVGSVLVVGALYVITIFVATSALGSERLADLGEVAIVEVARELLGPAGAVALLAAGVFATLSSANASILSSSRTVYAVSRDRLLPDGLDRISERFRTPHVALLLTGVPITALVLVGRVEVLAEVASLLHLVMYGLVCVVLIRLRRERPAGYRPDFECPGYPAVPLLGAAASFGLVAFMQPLSIAIGGGLIAASLVWYLAYASRAADEFPGLEEALAEGGSDDT